MTNLMMIALKSVGITVGLLYTLSVASQLYALLKSYVNYKKGQWQLNLLEYDKEINDDRSALEKALGIKK